MEIKFDDIKQHTDHQPGFDFLYEKILQRAKEVKEGIPFIEFGVRSGGSALLALWAINESKVERPMITVDPYGEKFWLNADGKLMNKPSDGYGEDYYRATMSLLTGFCVNNKLDWWHYRMTDLDFMRYWERAEVWYKKDLLPKTFGYAYLDAEHDMAIIRRQYRWFRQRMVKGGLISIDDIVVDFEGTYTNDGVNRSFIDF